MIFIAAPKQRGSIPKNYPKGWVTVDGLPLPTKSLQSSDVSEWLDWASGSEVELIAIGEEADVTKLLNLEPELGAILAGVLGLGRDGRPVEFRASAMVTTAALFGEFEDTLDEKGLWPVEDTIFRNIRQGLAAGMKVGRCWALSVPQD